MLSQFFFIYTPIAEIIVFSSQKLFCKSLTTLVQIEKVDEKL